MRKIRNTLKFILGTLGHDFDVAKDLVPFESLGPVERWMLAVLHRLDTDCREAYDDFAFSKVVQKVMGFLTQDVSAVFLEYAKDLYNEPPASSRALALKTVLYHVRVTSNC